MPQQQRSLVPAAAKQMIGLPVEYARYPSCRLQQQALAFVPWHVSARLESLPVSGAPCFSFEKELHDSLRTVPLLLLLVNGFSAATDKVKYQSGLMIIAGLAMLVEVMQRLVHSWQHDGVL